MHLSPRRLKNIREELKAIRCFIDDSDELTDKGKLSMIECSRERICRALDRGENYKQDKRRKK